MAATVFCDSGLRLTAEYCRQEIESFWNAVVVKILVVERDETLRAIKRETEHLVNQ
jgi:hypothetical protein